MLNITFVAPLQQGGYLTIILLKMTSISIFGRTVALLSFILGTCLLSFHLYFGKSFISLTTGFYFVIMALVINTITLIITLIYALVNVSKRLELLQTCASYY